MHDREMNRAKCNFLENINKIDRLIDSSQDCWRGKKERNMYHVRKKGHQYICSRYEEVSEQILWVTLFH